MRAGLWHLPLTVIWAGLAAASMYIPALFALILRDHAEARAFFYSGTLSLALLTMIAMASARFRPRDARRAHLLALVLAYGLLPPLLALPLYQALPGLSFGDAWFEMLSCFTTTGFRSLPADLFLSPALDFWRGFVAWMGGFFILVAATAILAPLNLGGAEVLSGTAPGGLRPEARGVEPRGRLWREAGLVFPAYASFTLLLWAALTFSGLPSFTALSYAMATLSTSGILPAGASAPGLAGEGLIALFLLLALSRRGLSPTAALGPAAPRPGPWRDPELRFAFFLLAALLLAILARRLGLPPTEGPPLPGQNGAAALWGLLFTALSYLTTTGFHAGAWPVTEAWASLSAPALLLAGLAIMGGGIATTAGGVKLLRLYALFRQGERELERQIHPHSLGRAGPLARRLRREGAYLAWLFFVLFGLSLAAIAGALSFLGAAFDAAVLQAVAALSNVGPLADFAGADLSAGGTQVILGLAMVLGRVETFAFLALLTLAPWRQG